MKITFNINYRTHWGESVCLCGNIIQLGAGNPDDALEMKPVYDDLWTTELEFSENPGAFEFFFIVKSKDKPCRFEWGKPHRFEPTGNIPAVKIFSSWQDMPKDKPYYSSAFTKGILNRKLKDKPLGFNQGTIQFQVSAPMVYPDEVLAVCGEGNLLGNWLPSKALVMNDSNYPVWSVNIPVNLYNSPFEYKFVVLKKESKEVVAWETVNNRICGFVNEDPGSLIIVEGLRFENPRDNWKGAGTAIPVFSLRSPNDNGVGDFVDLKKMADWCALTGQKILQVLPVNDTTKTNTWMDCYPYSACSTFALHPMFLRLEEVGILNDKKKFSLYKKRFEELNNLDAVDYEAVNKLKLDYLSDIFVQEGAATLKSSGFKSFFGRNEEWLTPYAAWRVLCMENGTPDNSRWGEFVYYDYLKVKEFCRTHRDQINFHYFIQYHLDRQLKAARDYAHSKGVVLKGDIPIGISRHSADAWQFPHLFNLNCQAGAPPDDFSVFGQNWGFPTYNWDLMANDGYFWWKERLKKMSEYFDAYRIDHILGFFRIWEIPYYAIHGLLGYFNPAIPFSPDELIHTYDFRFHPEVQVSPLISAGMLPDVFGEYEKEVISSFLDNLGDGRFALKKFVNNQRKIVQYFANIEHNDKNETICRGLMNLLDDVLFIEDPYKKGHYHPRIAAWKTTQYQILSDYDKRCFDKLYHDFFFKRNNDFWADNAMKKLPALIDSTGMLCCGEDLGMIPACVPEVMSRLQILSLEIQRMPKSPKQEFGDTWRYPYFSVCSSSTHDMSGIRAWWESNHDISQRFYNNILHEPGDAPRHADPWICKKIVELQLESPSMFCILPLADWLSINGDLRRENPYEEQINDPAVQNHYWRYRMHLPIEKLIEQKDFNKEIKNYLNSAER